MTPPWLGARSERLAMLQHLSKRSIKKLLFELADSRLQNGAAALAFFSMLAIFPTAIFALSLLPYLPIRDLQREIFELLGELMPREAAELFNDTVHKIVSERHSGILSFGESETSKCTVDGAAFAAHGRFAQSAVVLKPQWSVSRKSFAANSGRKRITSSSRIAASQQGVMRVPTKLLQCRHCSSSCVAFSISWRVSVWGKARPSSEAGPRFACWLGCGCVEAGYSGGFCFELGFAAS